MHRPKPSSFPTGPGLELAEFRRALRRQRRLWLLPTLVIGGLSLVYAVIKSDKWEAAQALLVRADAHVFVEDPVRSEPEVQTQMRQETVHEMLLNRAVLARALRDVGPPAGKTASPQWPTADDVEQLRERVKLSAPKGAEFGKTEVFYLVARDKSRGRAMALARAISQQVAARFQKLVEDKAAAEIDERRRAVALAEAEWQTASAALAKLETEVGADLGELRMLHGSPAGESDQRKKLVSVEGELRQARTERQETVEVLDLLRRAQQDPSQLLAAPNRLLDAHAGIGRLKSGLIDARLRTAALLGTMSEKHPQVVVARVNEAEVLRNLHAELPLAIGGVESELRVTDGRIALLEEHLTAVTARLDRLASLRTQYATLSANVEQYSRQMEQARRSLTEAEASRAAALSSQLVTRIDEPDTGPNPAGPGRLVIAAGGLFAGLLTGLGLLFLSLPDPRAGHSLPSPPDDALATTQPDVDQSSVSTQAAVPATSSAPAADRSFSTAAVPAGGDAVVCTVPELTVPEVTLATFSVNQSAPSRFPEPHSAAPEAVPAEQTTQRDASTEFAATVATSDASVATPAEDFPTTAAVAIPAPLPSLFAPSSSASCDSPGRVQVPCPSSLERALRKLSNPPAYGAPVLVLEPQATTTESPTLVS